MATSSIFTPHFFGNAKEMGELTTQLDVPLSGYHSGGKAPTF